MLGVETRITSRKERNAPTVWKVFADGVRGLSRDPVHHGYSFAITTGDILFARVFGVLASLGVEPGLRARLVGEVSRVSELTGYGQNLDMYLSLLPLGEVREEDVLRMYYLKTSVYSFEGPLRMGALLAGDEEALGAYSEYAGAVGIAFQVHDDILGAFGDPSVTGKPVGSDIREGKRTVLALYAYANGGERERRVLEEVLGKEDASEEEVREVMEIFEETGALDYARELERRYAERAVAALEGLERPLAREVLEDLAWYVVSREK